MHDDAALISQLESRIERLESDLERLSTRVGPADLTTPPGPATGVETSTAARTGRSTTARSRFFVETETLLRWGGVLLVVLAVGFAVSAAITRGWIGPELQLAGATGVSLALIAAGLRLRPTRLPWTHALCSGGVLALFSTVASDLFLEHASADVAFTCTALIGSGGFALARIVPSTWLGSATLLGGMAGWLVIADGDLPYAPTVIWFGFLVATAIVWSLAHRWFGLRFLAHGVGLIALFGIADTARQPAEQLLLLVVGSGLAGSLTRLPSIGDLTSPWQQLDIQLATLVAPWTIGILGLTLDIDTDAALGSVGLAVAGASAVVASALRPRLRPSHFVSLLIGASVATSIGVALLLTTSAAFVALAVQGAGLVVLGRLLGNSPRVLVNAAGLLLIATMFALEAMLDAWADDVPVGDDLAHLAIIGALAVAGWQTRRRPARCGAGGAGLGLVLIWLGSVLVHLPQGQAAVSVSWTMVGTAVLVAGAIRKIPTLGGAGLAVLVVTVAKLLSVDLERVDTLWRAGLFLLVGLGIMRLGFLLPRLTGSAGDRIEPTGDTRGPGYSIPCSRA